MAPTPKSQDRKRKSTASEASTTPAKKRAAKVKGETSTSNFDAEDPFSFESKEDSHPEPLKNISIERTAFGGVKFSRSPPNASQRYISVEKIAERRGNVSGTLTSPISTPRPGSLGTSLRLELSQNSEASNSLSSTPKAPKSKKTATVRASASKPKDANEKESSVTSQVATPGSSKRRAKVAEVSTPKEDVLKQYCVVPTLTAEQQLEVDHSIQHHQHKLLEAGARVFALWTNEYYAAIICGRDGLSRYYVHFVEDNLNRLLPPNGVVPLSILKNGMKISVILLEETEETGKRAEIMEVPHNEKADEWNNGSFKVRVEDEEEILEVDWFKIYLTKDQHKVISATDVNTTVFVEEENIVNESRSSRRSRSTRFSLDSSATAGHVATPRPAANRSKAAKPVAKTPKTPINEEEASETPAKEEEDEEAEEALEKSATRRSTRRSSTTAESKTPAKTPAKTSAAKKTTAKAVTPAKTPAKRAGRKTPARKAKGDDGDGEEEEKAEEADEKHDSVEKDDDELKKASEQLEPVEEEKESDAKEEESADAEMAEEKSFEEKSEQPVEKKEETKDTTLEKMDVDEGGDGVQEAAAVVVGSLENKSANVSSAKLSDSVVEHNLQTTPKQQPSIVITAESPQKNSALNQLNGSATPVAAEKVQTPEKQEQPPLPSQESFASATDELNSSPAAHNNNISSNGTTKPTDPKPLAATTSNSAASLNTTPKPVTAVATQPLPTFETQQEAQPAVSISVLPPPSNDQEASIFKNMKFVLTSATRAKKNSDFNKRDYRAKIEERGGEIIDDFTALKEGDTAFLIADTYYRTHKYLSALSASVPCVKHNWIYECVTEKNLVDHVPFMLPAGESSLVEGKVCEWRPLKNILLKNKRVWVYSNITQKPDERAISFVDIWSSIIQNLGATLVKGSFSSLQEKLEMCEQSPVNILLTDASCERQLADKVKSSRGIAVSSEWVIQAIVTGELPDICSSDRFRFDSSA